eukprot:467398_1
MEDKLRYLKAENTILGQKCLILEQRLLDNTAQYRYHNMSLTIQVNQINCQIKDYQSQLRSEQEQNVNYRMELESLRNKIGLLSNDMILKEVELKKKETKINQLEGKCAILHNELQVQQPKYQEAIHQLQFLQEKYNALRQEFNDQQKYFELEHLAAVQNTKQRRRNPAMVMVQEPRPSFDNLEDDILHKEYISTNSLIHWYDDEDEDEKYSHSLVQSSSELLAQKQSMAVLDEALVEEKQTESLIMGMSMPILNEVEETNVFLSVDNFQMYESPNDKIRETKLEQLNENKKVDINDVIIQQEIERSQLEMTTQSHLEHVPLYEYTHKDIRDRIKLWIYGDIKYKNCLLKTMQIFVNNDLSGSLLKQLSKTIEPLLENQLVEFMSKHTIKIVFKQLNEWRNAKWKVNEMDIASKSEAEIGALIYNIPLNNLIDKVIS